MSSFASWGLTILGLAIVLTISEMLLPHGKTRKVIRSVFATITVLVIVTPLPSLLRSGFKFDIFDDGAVQVDTGYAEYIDNAKKQLIVSAANEYVKGLGYVGVEIDVELDGGWTVKTAVIKFSNSSMTENGEHINKSEIIKLIADYFDIGEEAIMTYG